MQNILNKVQQNQGFITANSKIFAQIAYHLKYQKNGFILCCGSTNNQTLINNYFLSLSENFEEAYTALQNIPSNNKRVWLVLAGVDKYLGLSSNDNAPKIQSRLEWAGEMIQNLTLEAHSLRDSASPKSRRTGLKIMNILIKHSEITNPNNWFIDKP